jgi:tetratricopeptide (TPR) repeat protein
VERIGPYEPLAELGRGGMGVVLRARCSRTGREVALKLLQTGATDAPGSEVARFDQEVQALVRLRHPSIVAVLDAGSSARGPWVAMELLEGESLHARLVRDGPLEPGEAVSLARTLCGALDHAHAMGVLHRDVKPQNVLLARDGRAVLVDFGLARLLGRESRLTLTGEVMGTPCYMAPEQADGAACGPQTDVYGLGATLYQALTGQPPLRGKSQIELLHRVLSVTPDRPEALRPGLPPALGDLVMRCLEKDPARRPATPAALAEALERAALEGPRGARRPRLLVPAVGLVGAALAVASVVHARCAERGVDEATRAAAPDAPALLMRSRAQVRLKDAAGALASAEAALALAPASAAALCQRANARVACGQPLAALADCARVAAIDEVEARLLGDAALIAWMCEDLALAEVLARRATRLDPTLAVACRVLVEALVRSPGQLDEALAVVTRLLEDPRLKPPDAGYVLGLLLNADAARARAPLARARTRWPDDDPILLMWAVALGRTGESGAAVAAWSSLVDRSPDDVEARRARAQMRAGLQDLPGAAEDAERAAQLAPEDPDSWRLLSIIRERQGDHAGAEAALTRLIALLPDVAELHRRRASARGRLGQWAGLLDDLERVSQLAPDHGMGWVNLSQARRRVRDLAGALAAAERGVELVPGRFEAFGARAQALEELGRLDEARRDYARALELAQDPRSQAELRRSVERLAQ